MIFISTLFLVAALWLTGVKLWSRYQVHLKDVEEKRVSFVRRGLSQEFLFIEPSRLSKNLRIILVIGFVATFVVQSIWPLLLSLVISWFLPQSFLKWVQKKRQARFEKQLPALLPALSSSLKAGHTVERALETLSRTQSPPMSQELELILKEIRLGTTLEIALEELGKRFPNRELEIVIRAISISRRVGSNLAEVLDQVTDMVLARIALRNRLSGLTIQGQTQAWIAIGMPILLTLALNWIAPGYLAPLFETTMGHLILGGSLLGMVVGGFWIYRISHTELLQ